MKRLLIAEDDNAIALGLQHDLTFEGYAVETRSDGLLGEALNSKSW